MVGVGEGAGIVWLGMGIAMWWCWTDFGGRFANMEALREIHRVLKPAGVLGLVWNIEDCAW